MRRFIIGLVLFVGLPALLLLNAAESRAQGCGAGSAPFTTWSVCDFDHWPDGSYMHCDVVYVFGFGGTNCWRVFPARPL
jgi:hypothetical protein